MKQIQIQQLKFPTWDSIKDKYYCNLDIPQIHIWFDSNDTINAIARIKWCYTSQYFAKENFTFTEQGYTVACQWLQEQFENMVEELAKGNGEL